MSSSGNRLPRLPHADRPRADEKILKRTGADLNNGWLARHGTLYLTDQRLVFVPTALDHLLGAKRREIARADLEVVERWPLSPGGMPRGAKRPRLILHANGVRYQVLLPDLDGWFDLLQVFYAKARKGDPGAHMPEFRREGVDNALLEVMEEGAPT